MYKGFFGLKEIPFSIAPNPDYLYMSERHKEALAHLMFGLHETGGFVLLTGEVGTGKTTVSRRLLAQIPEQTQVAFVLNPSLSEWELLASVCDEFNIKYDKENISIKALTDAIKGYLQTQHEAGKRCLLIIDEAQHLRAEVLEQLRLLTNLETNTQKLLQVILIGQPELQALLKRKELRQLAQRITARYHLLPLNKEQVAFYINHRMNIAGCNKAIFTKKAVDLIFKISGGIPRIINLLCDRALMGAYVKEQQKVDATIVKKAAQEALDYEQPVGFFWQSDKFKYSVGAATLTAILLAGAFFYITQPELTDEPISKVQLTGKPSLVGLHNSGAGNRLQTPDTIDTVKNDIHVALANLSTLWKVEYSAPAQDFCENLTTYALKCEKWKGDAGTLVALNIPAVIELYETSGKVFYALLLGVSEGNYTIQLAEHNIEVSEKWFAQRWRGQALLIWQPPHNLLSQVDFESDKSEIQWLDTSLSAVLQMPRRNVEQFDATLANKLSRFQNRYNLPLSPYADKDSLILLQQLLLSNVPKLERGA
ncbi:AAA family ATPase [Catenovulum sediminis]|uniref:AAA family ATPase n=1 Tax=Catenovulum sediminis TaxID=1740262 RepID=A0ABV1RJ51_9ALTE|nr:AAA family ATPase [Catenovulum sediminis]